MNPCLATFAQHSVCGGVIGLLFILVTAEQRPVVSRPQSTYHSAAAQHRSGSYHYTVTRMARCAGQGTTNAARMWSKQNSHTLTSGSVSGFNLCGKLPGTVY